MIELIAQLSAGAASMPAAVPPPKAVALDPVDTKSFSLMMDGGIQTQSVQAKPPVAEPTALQRAVMTQGAEFQERFHALDQKRQALITSDMSDPTMTMWRSVDFSFQSTSLFTHLNLASGLATAVNNSFNSLFKNQS